ncbi:MAG: regulator of RNase E activity RraB [Vicingaceae bacterium]
MKFLETVKSWIPTASVFDIKIEKEPSWVNYEAMKPNEYNWQQIGNQQVIEELESNGSDPEKMHKLEFSFGGDLSSLEKLKTILIAEDAKLLLFEGDLLEVEFECLLDNSEIDPLSHFLLDTAKEHSCKYEGWRAAIVK